MHQVRAVLTTDRQRAFNGSEVRHDKNVRGSVSTNDKNAMSEKNVPSGCVFMMQQQQKQSEKN